MPLFQYKGRNQRGEAVKGRIEAASPEAVASQLFASGVTPIDIVLARAGNDVLERFRTRLAGDRIGLTDLVLFSRQMYTLLKAGVPLMQALKGLQESTPKPGLAEVIARLNESLDAGLELSAALRRHPQVFSSLYVSMIQVGESTGSLDQAFLQIAQYLEREKDMRERVKSALRYPVIVLAAMAIAIVVLNVFVIPAFARVYAGFRIELPWATKLLIASSEFTIAYWYIVLAAVLAAAVAVRLYVNTPAGRYRWHRLKLRLPVVGRIVYKATLGRFAQALGVMIRAGVPLVQAMTVVSRAVDNDYIAERILQMRDGVERGETIARTAVATGMFPSLVVQMIRVGEESGAVDELLANVADYYEREVDYDLKNLSTAIQPLLVVVLGVLVLILALGVFLPMWDLVQVARQG